MLAKMKETTGLGGEGEGAVPTVKRSTAYTQHLERPLCESNDVFPCLLLACGSAFGSLKVVFLAFLDLVTKSENVVHYG